MPYRAPTIDDFNHAIWLKRNRRLSPDFDPFVNEMAERVRRASGVTERADAIRNIQVALSVILANLYKSHIFNENRYIIIDRSNDGYKISPHNPLRLNRRAIQICVRYLITQEPSYVESRGGNFNIEERIGHSSRLRASERLIREIEDFLFNQEIHQREEPRIIRNTLRDNPQSLLVSTLFREEPLPLIRLRGPKPARREPAPLLSFDPTNETQQMEANLGRYNDFLSEHHWIDLLIPDQEFRALTRTNDQEADEFGDRDDDRWELDLLGRNRLYRVFNNGTFAEGGRFYGGWWQGVKSRLRRHLTINWFPTAELDYSNMQIAMLYAGEGLQLEGDAYTIDGIPGAYRKLIKRTMLKIINADGRMRAPRRAELPEGWTWRDIQEAVRDKHRPIARHFRTGEGIRLQRRDADIAESVMMTLMNEGILALPIHDSFVVEEGRQGRLREVMIAAYREHMGHPIRVDQDEAWFDLLPVEAMELAELGVRDLEEWIDDVEGRPGYENYRRRREDFIRLRGEAWGHAHRWHH